MSFIPTFMQIALTVTIFTNSKANFRQSQWMSIVLSDILVPTTTNMTLPSLARCAAKCLEGEESHLTFSFSNLEKLCFLYTNRLYSQHFIDGTGFIGLKYYWTYPSNGCQNAYYYHANLRICFRVYTNAFAIHNQVQAQSKCSQDNGHLFFMDTAEKADYIYEYVETAGKGRHNYYLGADDRRVPGKYEWFDGSSINESMWNDNEPDQSKQCVVSVKSSSTYKLKTVSCSTTWHYLCEIPVI